MANSKYTYVREFEEDAPLLNECWAVVRVDGRAFGAFSDQHGFRKPNEPKGLALINAAAVHLMAKFDDIILAYGHSDEYRKILSSVVSYFSACYCHLWARFFPDQPLLSVPSFDGRIVLYPTYQTVVDYFSWRHVDCHINNQYNTCFWCLVLDGKSHDEAYNWLKVEKNEYLFKSHGLNYNNLPNMFKKGTTLVRAGESLAEMETKFDELNPGDKEHAVQKELVDESRRISLVVDQAEINELEAKVKSEAAKHGVLVLHTDTVKDSFWSIVGPTVLEQN